MRAKIIKLLGFSLLEILLALAIIGILACIIYPTYNSHIVKTRRSLAIAAMNDIAGRLEEFYLQNAYSYKGATIATLNINDSSFKDYYQIDINSPTSTTYCIQAIPIGSQAKEDTQCETLKLDQNGAKSNSGPATMQDCWF